MPITVHQRSENYDAVMATWRRPEDPYAIPKDAWPVDDGCECWNEPPDQQECCGGQGRVGTRRSSHLHTGGGAFASVASPFDTAPALAQQLSPDPFAEASGWRFATQGSGPALAATGSVPQYGLVPQPGCGASVPLTAGPAIGFGALAAQSATGGRRSWAPLQAHDGGARPNTGQYKLSVPYTNGIQDIEAEQEAEERNEAFTDFVEGEIGLQRLVDVLFVCAAERPPPPLPGTNAVRELPPECDPIQWDQCENPLESSLLRGDCTIGSLWLDGVFGLFDLVVDDNLEPLDPDVHELIEAAWAILLANIDLAEWVACLFTGLEAFSSFGNESLAKCLRDRVLGQGAWFGAGGNVTIKLQDKVGSFLTWWTPFGGIIHIRTRSSTWQNKYVALYKNGDEKEKFCIAADLAGTLLHELVHTCLAGYSAASDESCECEISYLIENAFRWALGQRYTCLAGIGPCCYYASSGLLGNSCTAYPDSPPPGVPLC